MPAVPRARPALRGRPPPRARPSYRWARETLARLTLEEKVGADDRRARLRASTATRRAADARKLRDQVRDAQGRAAWWCSSPRWSRCPRAAERAAGSWPTLPLLVAADMERGHGLPHPPRGGAPALRDGDRAPRARRRPRASRARSTAREGRALGIHWAFAPVADVNNNPANPVINIRSFGEDPELVARLAAGLRARARARAAC